MVRHPEAPLLPRLWELREHLTAYDATYVALAEALGCRLLTFDGGLARAPGPKSTARCFPRVRDRAVRVVEG